MDNKVDALTPPDPPKGGILPAWIFAFYVVGPFLAFRATLCGGWGWISLKTMAQTPDPDATLMLRAKDGDLRAFEELVEKYKQPIVNLMFRMLHDLAEAEDMAQTVFLKVYQSMPRYQVSAKFSTWIFTIARHACLNEIRRRSRHPAESIEATMPDSEEATTRQFEDQKTFTPPEAFLQGELETKIQEALDDLPEKQRMAVLLCRQDELSYEEIAGVLELSLSATKSLIHRARETLKLRLKPYLQTGAWEEEAPETLPLKRCL